MNSRLQPWQGCTLPLSYSREMEAASRFELENGGFADLCLTTWLCRHFFWSGKRDLNSRLQPWQGCTLPLSYSRSRKAKQFLTFCHQTVNTFLKFIFIFMFAFLQPLKPKNLVILASLGKQSQTHSFKEPTHMSLKECLGQAKTFVNRFDFLFFYFFLSSSLLLYPL